MSDLVTIETQPTQQPKRNLNLCYSPNLRDHFPFDEIRPAQEIGLDAIEQAYRENKKFIIIEAPTGSGKSGMAIAAASHAKTVDTEGVYQPGSYILSPQKTLTAQYMKDFAEMGLLELKGKSNYECTQYLDEFGKPVDCEVGMLLCTSEAKKESMLDDDDEGRGKSGCGYCPYKAAKRAFVKNPLGVTNFAYYLGETSHAGQLENRNMLILDEGHNTENMILGFTDTEITKYRCREIGLTDDIPFIKPGETNKALAWLLEVFRPAMQQYMTDLDQQLEEAKQNGHGTEVRGKIAKKLNGIKMFANRLARFINAEDKGEWLVWTEATKGTSNYGNMIIRPLTATLFADEILFNKAKKVLIMSATILDFPTFMRNLGIRREDAVCVRIPCDFPKENRWVDYLPVGSMSSTQVKCPTCGGSGCPSCWNSGKVKAIDATLPKMAQFVDKIISSRHGNEKGIVHTHSYKVNDYITNRLSDEQRMRVVTHTSAKGERDRAVVNHFEAEFASVLFSPSMSEGLDLKDDLSRFSIIVKVPYPFLDPYVKARMERDPDWYAWQTALVLVQATGRSNRHKNDVAHHYILDEAFAYFMTKNEKMFPQWWLEAIRWPQDRKPRNKWAR